MSLFQLNAKGQVSQHGRSSVAVVLYFYGQKLVNCMLRMPVYAVFIDVCCDANFCIILGVIETRVCK